MSQPSRRSPSERTADPSPRRSPAVDDAGPPPLDPRRALRAVARSVDLLSPGERLRWAALIPLTAIAAGLEAGGAILVLTLIRYLTDPTAIDGVDWTTPARHWLGLSDRTDVLVSFSGALALFFLAKNLVLVGTAHYGGRCAGRSVDALSTRLLRGYLHAPYLDHVRRGSAELVRNVNGAVVSAFRMTLITTVEIVKELVLLLALLLVLLVAAPGVTLVAMGGLGLVLLGFLRVTQGLLVQWGHEGHQLNGVLLRELERSLGAVKAIQVFGREEYFVRSFQRARTRLSRLEWRQATLHGTPRLMMETLFVGAVAVVVVLFERTGRLEEVIPVLGLFAYTGFRLLPALHRVTSGINVLRFGSTAVEEVWEDAARYAREPAPKEPLRLDLEDRLELVGVRFTYPGTDRPAVDGVSLAIPRGGSVALVGPTGGGKSTLLDLLLGVLTPDEGEVRLDGRSLIGRERAFRASVGYVPQSLHLVDDTLRRNVTLGEPDDAIDEARVREACAAAQLGELLDRLPAGLDTRVGTRGVRLSGGERQRVAIARALYRRPSLLFLDEATSNVDNETERAIVRALERVEHEMTLVVVAHRLDTVRGLDRLYFLEDGRVTAQGPFDELAQRHPPFRAMVAQ